MSTRPAKGTPEYDLWIAAIEIAASAAWKQNKSSNSAQVPWDEIHALRTALEAVGIDWQNVKRETDQRQRAAMARLNANRSGQV